MLRRIKRIKQLTLLMAAVASGQWSVASGQPGQGDPSPVYDCGSYQWPAVQSPCPEVQIKQKHDHTPLQQYRRQGWDTVVTCRERQVVLSCMPYIPVQFFNGYYYVDEIPYNPPDTSFWMNGQGTQQDINSDDRFAPTAVQLDFPFFFFGIQKTQFRISDNGHVTFTNNFSADGTGVPLGCPYSFQAMPWTSANTPTYSGDCFNRMHDAIYGVYEDTYTGVNGAYMSGHQGIYYGVVDEWPCRKIIATWNEIPVYSNQNQRHSYQIVCYEGSNIVEVHVKNRTFKPSTSQGLIGIQNATGTPQQKSSDPDNPLYWITPNAPPAFWPAGYNLIQGTQNITNKAFRFTPVTTPTNTEFVAKWYRILADTTVELTTNPNDPNGYYTPMGTASPSCPRLTLAYVSPTEESRYYFQLKFQNANGDWYDLRDTITIGVDTLNNLSFNVEQRDICLNEQTSTALEFLPVQDTEQVEWVVRRISGGDSIVLPGRPVAVSGITEDDTSKRMVVTLNSASLPTEGRRENKIDSIYIEASVDFVSGCHNKAVTLVRIFPNFDTTVVEGICRGERFRWADNGETYTESTRATATLQSQPGCDSVVHLDLTVYDKSLTIDTILDCRPITWINGKTYSQSNTGTFSADTVMLKNRYGCDSIVQLDFTLHPLTARINSSLEHFDYDHLDVELTDVSVGGDVRTWKLPDSPDQNAPVVYYTIPTARDSAEIMLIESSPYGCKDTATLTLQFFKENFFVPNVFTPDNPAGNNLFGSVSLRTLTQEMHVYNRRGELVHYCNTPDCKWDGRDLHGQPCVQGAYVYIIRYTTEFEPSRTHVRKGTVTLLR